MKIRIVQLAGVVLVIVSLVFLVGCGGATAVNPVGPSSPATSTPAPAPAPAPVPPVQTPAPSSKDPVTFDIDRFNLRVGQTGEARATINIDAPIQFANPVMECWESRNNVRQGIVCPSNPYVTMEYLGNGRIRVTAKQGMSLPDDFIRISIWAAFYADYFDVYIVR